jgi:hypothetical protein
MALMLKIGLSGPNFIPKKIWEWHSRACEDSARPAVEAGISCEKVPVASFSTIGASGNIFFLHLVEFHRVVMLPALLSSL